MKTHLRFKDASAVRNGNSCSAVLRGVILVLGLLGLAGAQTVDSAHLAGLKWRNIGPFRGGRVSAVTGVISQPDTFYIGLPLGGVWKTTSAGQTWYPIFDAVKGVSSVGSVQVSQSNPDIVYAGTGEISGGGEGNGVYRSSDAGKTWTHVGLNDSKVVPTLIVDPHNPDLVIAAALGGFSSGKDLGVYRTNDGGNSWARTLFIDDKTGVQHLAWAYDNPKVIYAETWSRSNMFARPAPGAKGPSGPEIYKSLDEGLTWKKVAAKGLPNLAGRVCMAVAQGTNSQRLFLIGTFGLYRSDDGGSNWRQMAADDSRIANGQGFYSSGVYVDPQNSDIVYTLATCVYRSLDGGKTFEGFKGAPGGDDPQQLWIDPTNRTHLLLGGDQGATVSLDAGKTWGSWYNQPTGQVYHVSTDNQFPYWVYATQQDSGCIGTSSRGNLGAITPFDWMPHPGNEGGYIVIDPLNPKVSYAVGPVAGIIKVTYPSGTWVQVEPNMAPESGLRASGQLAFSPTNPHELLLGSQFLLSTTDGGIHWNKLSPDLTADPDAMAADKQLSRYASIMSFCASPVARGVIWAGTTNGFIKLTKDHGATWNNVSLPRKASSRRGSIFCIEASHVDAATAYVSVSGTSTTDTHGHLFRTHDFGATWTEMGKDLPQIEPGFNRVSTIQGDSKRAGLLFALSNGNVFVSINDGDNWQSLNLDLPTTEFSDLIVHGNDLVLGTFGRGIWILDDYSPLREIGPKTESEAAHLFKPAVAFRLRRNVNDDTPLPPEVPHAENPPLGAVIYYSLATKPASEVKLEILDERGRVVRHMSNAPVDVYDDPAPLVPIFWVETRKSMPANVGLNRINWNIRFDTPPAFNHDVSDVMGAMTGDTPAAIEGPLALPGNYTVRLTVDGKAYSQKLTVQNDPRSTATRRDLELEHRFRMTLYAGIREAWDGYHQVGQVQRTVAAIVDSKPKPEVEKAAKEFAAKLTEVGGTATHVRRFYGPPSPTSFVGLNGFLLARLDSFDYGDMAPTDYMMATYGSDWAKLHAVSETWRKIQKKDLPEFNVVLRKNGIKPIEFSAPALIDPPKPDKRYLPVPEPPAKPESAGPPSQGAS